MRRKHFTLWFNEDLIVSRADNSTWSYWLRISKTLTFALVFAEQFYRNCFLQLMVKFFSHSCSNLARVYCSCIRLVLLKSNLQSCIKPSDGKFDGSNAISATLSDSFFLIMKSRHFTFSYGNRHSLRSKQYHTGSLRELCSEWLHSFAIVLIDRPKNIHMYVKCRLGLAHSFYIFSQAKICFAKSPPRQIAYFICFQRTWTKNNRSSWIYEMKLRAM